MASMTRLPQCPIRLVEIAEFLGVTKQRAHQIAEAKGFPEPVDRDGRGRLWNRREVAAWAVAPREAVALAVLRVVGDVVDEVFAVRESLGADSEVVVHVNGVEDRLDLLGRKLRRWRELIDDLLERQRPLIGRRTRARRRGAWRWDCSGRGYRCSDRKARNDRSHHESPSLHSRPLRVACYMRVRLVA